MYWNYPFAVFLGKPSRVELTRVRLIYSLAAVVVAAGVWHQAALFSRIVLEASERASIVRGLFAAGVAAGLYLSAVWFGRFEHHAWKKTR